MVIPPKSKTQNFPPKYLGKTLFLLLVFIAAQCFAAGSYPRQDILKKLVHKGGFIVQKKGRIVSSLNNDQLFVPGSISKIATSLAALHILGPEFRFETSFFLDEESNLYIKGMGDPFLISEEIEIISRKIKELGVDRINDIVLDNSSYQLKTAADGSGHSLNPYDVASDALSVNFNTVNIEVSTDGTVSSAEPQTPTLPIMQRLGRDLPPGIHRINISNDPGNITTYAGELFRAIIARHLVPPAGRIRQGKVGPGMRPLYIHHSNKNLLSVIEAMMRFSNNFIANQLFLACGATQHGYPADWQKGRQALRQFLQDELGLAKQQISLVEGSGLSRKNRLSPAAMIAVLEQFKPYASLLKKHNGARLKSGTLTGVYSYAGYFINQSNRLDSFVLILNQDNNNRNRLFKELKKAHRATDKII